MCCGTFSVTMLVGVQAEAGTFCWSGRSFMDRCAGGAHCSANSVESGDCNSA